MHQHLRPPPPRPSILPSFAFLAALAAAPPAFGGLVPRGDVNNDGKVDLSDAIALFEWLSENSGVALCLSAIDANLDGAIDYSDGVYLLQYMFLSGDEPLPFHPGLAPGCYSNNANFEVRNLRETALSPTSAIISWETPHASSTIVRYGAGEGGLSEELRVEERVHHHQALLEGLSPGTTYVYAVFSETAWGDWVRSEPGTFTTLTDPPLAVRESRPRLFFTAEDLPEIRARTKAGGAHAALWSALSGWASARLEMPVEEISKSVHLREHARAFAFAGLVGNSTALRKKAIELASYLVRTWPGENERNTAESLAVVYDWLHGFLSADERKAIAGALARSCKSLAGSISEREFVTGMSHGDNKSLFLAALALYGDDPRAEGYLARAVANYRYGFLATWRRFADLCGGSSKGWWYSTYALPFELEFFSAWKSATGQDLFETERTWLENVLAWFLFGLCGDGTFFREGDVYTGALSFENRHFGELVAKEYRNPQAQWFADRERERNGVWSPHAFFDILWHDPSVAPLPPVGALSRWFRDAGVVICRDSWGPESTVAKFRSAEAYTLGHAHLDNCSFNLYYKAPLALDTGLYDEYASEHYHNYYSRTIAHNSLLVCDPSEVFRKWGKAYANDGGQRWLVPGVDAVAEVPGRAEDTVARDRGFRLGGIFRYEDELLYTYAVGDGGPSYSPAKLDKFHRHFLFLRKVLGRKQPVVVIFDDVAATKAEFRKVYLLHTAEKPAVDGLLVSAAAKDAALHQWTVFPEDAEISLVGGRGKEFFVNGVNYPPSRTARATEEPGAWRVEVSPAGKRKSDRFLHVLFPADAGEPAPPRPEAIAAGDLCGVVVGEWIALFGGDEELLLAEYEAPRGGSHLVCGAIPLERYDVYLDRKLVDSAVASFSGVLRFDLGSKGIVRLVAKP
ncbi:MAG: fibronectin type III domain-containing protein [Planctomycetota bacterium]